MSEKDEGQSTAVVQRSSEFSLAPRNLEDAQALCKMLADSDMIPKDYQKKPGNIMVAIQWGAEIGLKPLQAMQNLAVINGRPSLWGDSVLALVLASPACKDVIETYEGTGEEYTAVCIAKRNGRADKMGRFSVADSKRAGLAGKQGPWTNYRDRMLKLRARAFALRDQFPDVLKGLPIAEEVQDYDETEVVNHGAYGGQAAATVTATVDPSINKDALIQALTDAMKKGGMAEATKTWNGWSKDERSAVGTGKRDEIIKNVVPDPVATQEKEPEKQEVKTGVEKPLFEFLLDKVAENEGSETLDKIWEQAADLPDAEREKVEAAINAKAKKE